MSYDFNYDAANRELRKIKARPKDDQDGPWLEFVIVPPGQEPDRPGEVVELRITLPPDAKTIRFYPVPEGEE
jgi:hypothetical protein